MGVIAVASASQDRIRDISWTRDLTSFESVVLERNWLNLAFRVGCDETWTLAGSDDMVTDRQACSISGFYCSYCIESSFFGHSTQRHVAAVR
jgi:hypothetical protein